MTTDGPVGETAGSHGTARGRDQRESARESSDRRPAPGPVFARLDRPRSDPPVTLAVIADPHVAVAARGTWKVYHRTLDRLRTAEEIRTLLREDVHELVEAEIERRGGLDTAVDRIVARENDPYTIAEEILEPIVAAFDDQQAEGD